MPLAVALFIRSLVQFAITLGAIDLAERLVLPLLNTALAAVARLFGVDEETAKNIVANELLIFVEDVGIGVLLLRKQIPTKVAEKLGFTTKGYTKRPVSATATRGQAGSGATAAKGVTGNAPTIQALAESVSRTRGVSLDTAQKWATIAIGGLGIPIGAGILITNTIDFGAWPTSAYQGTVQRLLAHLGLHPDKDSREPRTASLEVFNKVFAGLQLAGAKSINDPYKNQTVLFTRNNLLDLADKLAAQILVETGGVKTQALMAAILPLTDLSDARVNAATRSTPAAGLVPPRAAPLRVFTGIVSAGTLGAATQFRERQDDLIESVEELEEAARNNISAYLATLGGKLSYEIRIVPTVQTADGLRLTGGAQRVISSYNADGSPRHKTVINKFAVADIFIFTERNTRTKIKRITLGPTNAVKLQPTAQTLGIIETDIRQTLVTNDIAVVSGIETTEPVTVTAPPPAPRDPVFVPPTPPRDPVFVPPPQLLPTPQETNDLFDYLAARGQGRDFATLQRVCSPYGVTDVTQPGHATRCLNGLRNDEARRQAAAAVPAPAPAPVVKLPPPPPKPSYCGAQTLFEWYTAQGQPLPSVSARAPLYQSFGLGPAAYYSGTAEQNVRLLAALKAQKGC